MVTHILPCLIGIVASWLGRIEQRQAQRVVGGFVPSVARIVQDGHAILPCAVGQVGPFVGIHLEGIVAVIATAHAAQTDVVGGLFVADAEREYSFEQGILRPPVDLVLEVDAARHRTVVEMDALQDVAVAIALADDECLAQRSFLHRHLYGIVNADRFTVDGCFENLPGWPRRRAALVEDGQLDTLALSNQFLVGYLVEEAHHVAIFIDRQAVVAVFDSVG